MGAIAAAATIAGRNSPLISSPDDRQPPKDGYGGQNVHNLLSLKGLVHTARLGRKVCLQHTARLGSKMGFRGLDLRLGYGTAAIMI